MHWPNRHGGARENAVIDEVDLDVQELDELPDQGAVLIQRLRRSHPDNRIRDNLGAHFALETHLVRA